MPTDLSIDDEPANRARETDDRRIGRETVGEALREYIERRLRLEAVAAFGTVDFDPASDCQRARSQR